MVFRVRGRAAPGRDSMKLCDMFLFVVFVNCAVWCFFAHLLVVCCKHLFQVRKFAHLVQQSHHALVRPVPVIVSLCFFLPPFAFCLVICSRRKHLGDVQLCAVERALDAFATADARVADVHADLAALRVTQHPDFLLQQSCSLFLVVACMSSFVLCAVAVCTHLDRALHFPARGATHTPSRERSFLCLPFLCFCYGESM